MTLDAGVALEPLRVALLRHAQREAEAAVAAAERQAAEEQAVATTEADARVSAARKRGEAEAANAAVIDDARVRQEARTLILLAETSVYDEMRRRTHEAVRRLRDDSCYPRLRGRLETEGRARLGADAVSHDDPTGGVVIEAAGRRIEATLDALADWAVDALDVDVAAGSTP
jgi:vacuolar-type H+-ATPase subunit E/Vma4